jgi:ribonucleoside-diphosphate reductase alpha chain
LTRSRTDKLVVMPGGAATSAPSPLAGEGRGGGSATVTSLASGSARAEGAQAALRAAPELKLSPTERLEQQQLPFSRNEARANAAERRAQAKAKGYEGEACGECGNFTLVRNGTCMKCDTCGSTTGCS